ncbi:hypothetical protein [Pseudovibrio denitrificans]|uniref:hypothetical protein n=1 Tax=Pseudovibrio denitrificans TaxID=258256 RepID=UPI000A44B6CE|nr:hypothetical protein [Pseudovibrio denitrificans]
MRKWLLSVISALALAGAGFAVINFWPIGAEPKLSTVEGSVQRGVYLARMSGCIACHTDLENGGKPLAGGTKFATDFGTFYSPNLTTDKAFGMGSWSIEDFAKAVRQGISPEGEPYYLRFLIRSTPSFLIRISLICGPHSKLYPVLQNQQNRTI